MSEENIWTEEFNPFQKYKTLCWFDRMQKIDLGAFAPPVNIALDIVQGTSQKKLCAGNQCNFCMSDLDDRGELAKVPREVLFQIPRFFREWGVLSVCLAGHNSDPLVYNHGDLVQLFRLLHKNDIEAGLVSNGLLLTPELAQDVARNCTWTGFSVNAGKADTYRKITGAKPGAWEKLLGNIASLTEYARRFNLAHPVGFKFLVTDDNYREILDAVIVAKAAGCRHMQIRPCELPAERAARIDVAMVDDQLREAMSMQVPGEFEVFGVKEKFTASFGKKTPQRCIASPLGSTWKADGDIVICPDRRWSAHLPDMTLGNFLKEGLEGIRRKWGGPEHRAMIEAANSRIGECIRCTAYQWHRLYENTITTDPMNVRLI